MEKQSQKKVELHGYEVIITNLTFQPPEMERPVLSKINFKVQSGQFVTIVGANGAGKSSLLKIISGEIPTNQRKSISGSVTVGGQEINEPINRLIDGVGIVHQDDELDLISYLSVAQNIAIRQLLGGGHSPKILATPKGWRREVAQILAGTCPSLGVDLREKLGNLAGGKRQMLSVAIAIHLEHLKNPCCLLLLDEHTAKLDHKNQKSVMEFSKTQANLTKTTTIMVTHRYSDAVDYSDRILIMRNGEIVHDEVNNKTLQTEMIANIVDGVEKGNLK